MDYIYLKGLDTGNSKILIIGSDVFLRSDLRGFMRDSKIS